MFFKDIQGKEEEKQFLLSNVNSDRLAHAQLFLGRPGSGHLAVALAFANYLICQERIDGDSCGVCKACIKSHKNIHPDIHFAFPVVAKSDKRREDTTSNDFLPVWRESILKNPYLTIQTWMNYLHVEKGQADMNVKETVDIVKKLSLKTFEADHKVLILWMPEALGNEGNRLLKLIEEPPDKTIIILVADNQEQILNTILSRVQLLKVSPFTDEEIKAYLFAHYNLPEEEISQLVGLAAGNLDKAIGLTGGENNNFSDALFSWLRIAYKLEPVELGKWVNEISSWGRENQKHFLEYGLHYFREYLFSMLTGTKSVRLTAEELETSRKMKSILDVQKTEKIIHVINECIIAVSRNANAKILFMTESLKIGQIMRNAEVGDSIYQV